MSKAGCWAGIPLVQLLFFCQGPSNTPVIPNAHCADTLQMRQWLCCGWALWILPLQLILPALRGRWRGDLLSHQQLPFQKSRPALASALLETPLQQEKLSSWQHRPRDTHSFNVSRGEYRNKTIQMLFFPLHISVSAQHCLCSIARQRFCRF